MQQASRALARLHRLHRHRYLHLQRSSLRFLSTANAAAEVEAQAQAQAQAQAEAAYRSSKHFASNRAAKIGLYRSLLRWGKANPVAETPFRLHVGNHFMMPADGAREAGAAGGGGGGGDSLDPRSIRRYLKHVYHSAGFVEGVRYAFRQSLPPQAPMTADQQRRAAALAERASVKDKGRSSSGADSLSAVADRYMLEQGFHVLRQLNSVRHGTFAAVQAEAELGRRGRLWMLDWEAQHGNGLGQGQGGERLFYRVGEVVEHRSLGYRGVVLGWSLQAVEGKAEAEAAAEGPTDAVAQALGPALRSLQPQDKGQEQQPEGQGNNAAVAGTDGAIAQALGPALSRLKDLAPSAPFRQIVHVLVDSRDYLDVRGSLQQLGLLSKHVVQAQAQGPQGSEYVKVDAAKVKPLQAYMEPGQEGREAAITTAFRVQNDHVDSAFSEYCPRLQRYLPTRETHFKYPHDYRDVLEVKEAEAPGEGEGALEYGATFDASARVLGTSRALLRQLDELLAEEVAALSCLSDPAPAGPATPTAHDVKFAVANLLRPIIGTLREGLRVVGEEAKTPDLVDVDPESPYARLAVDRSGRAAYTSPDPARMARGWPALTPHQAAVISGGETPQDYSKLLASAWGLKDGAPDMGFDFMSTWTSDTGKDNMGVFDPQLHAFQRQTLPTMVADAVTAVALLQESICKHLEGRLQACDKFAKGNLVAAAAMGARDCSVRGGGQGQGEGEGGGAAGAGYPSAPAPTSDAAATAGTREGAFDCRWIEAARTQAVLGAKPMRFELGEVVRFKSQPQLRGVVVAAHSRPTSNFTASPSVRMAMEGVLLYGNEQPFHRIAVDRGDWAAYTRGGGGGGREEDGDGEGEGGGGGRTAAGAGRSRRRREEWYLKALVTSTGKPSTSTSTGTGGSDGDRGGGDGQTELYVPEELMESNDKPLTEAQRKRIDLAMAADDGSGGGGGGRGRGLEPLSNQLDVDTDGVRMTYDPLACSTNSLLLLQSDEQDTDRGKDSGRSQSSFTPRGMYLSRQPTVRFLNPDYRRAQALKQRELETHSGAGAGKGVGGQQQKQEQGQQNGGVGVPLASASPSLATRLGRDRTPASGVRAPSLGSTPTTATTSVQQAKIAALDAVCFPITETVLLRCMHLLDAALHRSRLTGPSAAPPGSVTGALAGASGDKGGHAAPGVRLDDIDGPRYSVPDLMLLLSRAPQATVAHPVATLLSSIFTAHSNEYVSSLHREGERLAIRGSTAAACKSLQRGLLLDPSFALLHKELAMVRYLQGDHDACRTHSRDALRLNPLDFQTWGVLGLSLATLEGRERKRLRQQREREREQEQEQESTDLEPLIADVRRKFEALRQGKDQGRGEEIGAPGASPVQRSAGVSANGTEEEDGDGDGDGEGGEGSAEANAQAAAAALDADLLQLMHTAETLVVGERASVRRSRLTAAATLHCALQMHPWSKSMASALHFNARENVLHRRRFSGGDTDDRSGIGEGSGRGSGGV